MNGYKYPGITLEQLIKEQQGLTLPELGSSAMPPESKFSLTGPAVRPEPQYTLGAETQLPAAKSVEQLSGEVAADAAGASGMASIGAAIPQGLATAASGIMKAQAILEQQKRKAMSEGAAEASKGVFQAQSQAGQAKINPLKALIANYRASIG